VKEHAAALDVTLTTDMIKRIEALVPAGFPLGARYPAEMMGALQHQQYI
jgi:hypothetical protein